VPKDSTKILERLLGSDKEDAMRPTTPILCNESGATSSSDAVLCKTKKASCVGLSNARIMAVKDWGLPSNMGVTVPGKRMMSRRGITGKPFAKVSRYSWLAVSSGGTSGSAGALEREMGFAKEILRGFAWKSKKIRLG
jgi:hypothetical protein